MMVVPLKTNQLDTVMVALVVSTRPRVVVVVSRITVVSEPVARVAVVGIALAVALREAGVELTEELLAVKLATTGEACAEPRPGDTPVE